MTTDDAIAWLSQPGIKAILPADPQTQQALDMAIKALEQNEKLKTFIKNMYRQGADKDIDKVACEHCSHRVDGKCPIPIDGSVSCPQSEEETFDLFFTYGLE